MLRSLSVVAAAVLLAAAAPAQDSTLKVKEGDKFPDIKLSAAQVEKVPGKKAGDTVGIADLKGKTVVVFFYPKAGTKGCTIESCGFRDLAEKFPKDTVLIGASADDEKAQVKFITENKLPYALLCDTDLKLIKELGIQNAKGKTPQRVSFVIDKEGKIAKIYTKVNVQDHPTEVLKQVEAMQK